jgi:hypothetical protein
MLNRTRIHSAFLCLFAVALACGDDLPAEPAAPVDAGPDPLLSHEPAWMARGDADEGCFGSAATAADLDGDGRSEVIVAIPRCTIPVADQLAVFRGQQLFSGPNDGMRVAIDWANANPPPFNYPMNLSVGDVDGDARADLLMSAPAGVILYRGGDDLARVFAEPAFRVPGEAFGSAFLADLNGDGRDDIAAAVGSATVVYLADGGETPAFAETRRVTGAPGGIGDIDADGRVDLFLHAPDGTVQLYLGCDGGAACDGGLGTESVWSAAGYVAGSDMDLDADGRGDVVLTDYGRIFVHTSGAADSPDALLSDSPTWVEQGDPIFLGFGWSSAAVPGAMGAGTGLVVAAQARTYLYRVPEDRTSELELAWALPAEDGLTEEWPIDFAYVVSAAGDVDADGYGDFLIAGSSGLDGMVMLFTGGQLADAARPYIPEPRACGALSGGLPDLTIDADAMARSLRITRDEFAEDACEVAEGCVGAPGQRKLLRFTAAIPNLGSADAVVPGPDEAPELYKFDECHGHDHLIGFTTYHLVGDGIEAFGHKQGYALTDIAPYCAGSAAPRDFFPSQGISAGWADVYIADFACQWVDITDLPDGTYELRVSVDDTDAIAEADELPNQVSLSVTIHGDKVSTSR